MKRLTIYHIGTRWFACAVVAKATDRFSWTALLITWAIAAAAWVVAGSVARDRPHT